MNNFLSPYAKIKWKCIIELYVRANTIETLEENTEVNINYFKLDNGFLDDKIINDKRKKQTNWILLNFTMFASEGTIKKVTSQ